MRKHSTNMHSLQNIDQNLLLSKSWGRLRLQRWCLLNIYRVQTEFGILVKLVQLKQIDCSFMTVPEMRVRIRCLTHFYSNRESTPVCNQKTPRRYLKPNKQRRTMMTFTSLITLNMATVVIVILKTLEILNMQVPKKYKNAYTGRRNRLLCYASEKKL